MTCRMRRKLLRGLCGGLGLRQSTVAAAVERLARHEQQQRRVALVARSRRHSAQGQRRRRRCGAQVHEEAGDAEQ